jgi:hypothetical protein
VLIGESVYIEHCFEKQQGKGRRQGGDGAPSGPVWTADQESCADGLLRAYKCAKNLISN